MTTLREAVAQALDALTKIHPGNMSWETGEAWMNAVQILREALAQPEPEPEPEPEPVAWMVYTLDGKSAFVTDNPKDFTQDHRVLPLYTTPPQRKPLTEEEIDELSRTMVKGSKSANWLCRAIERAHGIGGEK